MRRVGEGVARELQLRGFRAASRQATARFSDFAGDEEEEREEDEIMANVEDPFA